MISYTVFALLELLALLRYWSSVNWTGIQSCLHVVFLPSVLVVGTSGWSKTINLEAARAVGWESAMRHADTTKSTPITSTHVASLDQDPLPDDRICGRLPFRQGLFHCCSVVGDLRVHF
jgi:hypothetical protein